jgi:dihydropteroate synthase
MTEPATPRRVQLVSGRLAERALGRVIAGMELPFETELSVLNITVAALMTTDWIANHLQVAEDTDLVLIPGLCEGDVEVIREKWNVAVEKGPKDLHEIPRHFGREMVRDYGAWDIEIAAEINNAPRLTRQQIRDAAHDFHASGADIIDLGCTPGLDFPDLGDVVAELISSGMRVSVDSFDPDEIRRAVQAGAELVLSVNGSNIAVAEELAGSGARVVVMPDLGEGLDSLGPSIEKLDRWGVSYLIDPILEPIGFGFMASLERYAQIRRQYPEAEMLMGIGNLTELTAADSTGVNALLIAICQELAVRMVLTTEVIPWAHGSVREVDVARQLMHYAVTEHTIPKRVDDRLVTLKDPEVFAFTSEELEGLQAGITDSNYRIFADREGIVVLNNERIVRGTDIGKIFAQLEVDEATHAFYLGQELARASVAVTLGKTYRQDGALRWGYLTPPDNESAEESQASEPVKLTGGSRKPDHEKRTQS